MPSSGITRPLGPLPLRGACSPPSPPRVARSRRRCGCRTHDLAQPRCRGCCRSASCRRSRRAPTRDRRVRPSVLDRLVEGLRVRALRLPSCRCGTSRAGNMPMIRAKFRCTVFCDRYWISRNASFLWLDDLKTIRFEPPTNVELAGRSDGHLRDADVPPRRRDPRLVVSTVHGREHPRAADPRRDLSALELLLDLRRVLLERRLQEHARGHEVGEVLDAAIA